MYVILCLRIVCFAPPTCQLVLESPVQSGFLAQKKKTDTKTGQDVSYPKT